MGSSLTLLWLRRDLRLSDNPALSFAAGQGAVLPLYILEEGLGGASRWWLHHALADLGTRLAAKGAPLLLRRGDPLEVLRAILRETGAKRVVWSHLFEPGARTRDEKIAQALTTEDIEVQRFNSSLLFEPWALATKSGGPYKVFTPFSKACLAALQPRALLPAPKKLQAPPTLRGDELKEWNLLPSHPNWAGGLEKVWSVGEKAAQERLADFVDESLAAYKTGRDQPGVDGTSRLSPYMHFGQLSPWQIWEAVTVAMQTRRGMTAGAECFQRELLWREFSYHLLHHFPDLPDKPLQPAFTRMPWRRDPKGLEAWQKGLTGYPIVDAGMRQLWQTGWMHNRVRMIVASFLVKDLLLPWQAGETWFRETLVDADPANNAASWQWVAGCGADAAPFFRVFNPVLQGQKFDPQGAYIRKYVPELKGIQGPSIHAPWQLRAEDLAAAGVVLGRDYPKPILDHAAARLRALEALKKIKQA